jgi:lysophospholipase L1-like esterase
MNTNRRFSAFCRHVLAAGNVTVLVLLLTLTGCENDGESAHDFGDNNPDVVIAVGDSITADGYPSILSSITGKTVIDMGVGGASSMEGISPAIEGLSLYSPGYMLILFGANDIIGGDDFAGTVEALRSMIQAAQANNTVPVIGTLTPMIGLEIGHTGQVATLNSLIRQLAKQEGAAVADIASAFGDGEAYISADGLHPNSAGDVLIAETFARRID